MTDHKTAATSPKAKKRPLAQMFYMLGRGYFLITLIGILSFTLLFFILWFM